jgi:two-component system CheB/CheR fusion protein
MILFPSSSGSPQLENSTLTEVHFKLLERLARASVLVNAVHDIVHLSASAGRFLKLTGGEPTSHLLQLVDPLVRMELRSALFRCGKPTCR